MQKNQLDLSDLERLAIASVPKEVDAFIESAGSLRTRYFLLGRDFQFLLYGMETSEILRLSLLRLVASEIIRKQGVRVMGRPKLYNSLKLQVRAAVTQYIKERPAVNEKFERIVQDRLRKSIFARSRRVLNFFKRRPTVK